MLITLFNKTKETV